MFDNKNELEARQEILGIVDEYCKKYHNQKQYKEGDRISYFINSALLSKEFFNLFIHTCNGISACCIYL